MMKAGMAKKKMTEGTPLKSITEFALSHKYIDMAIKKSNIGKLSANPNKTDFLIFCPKDDFSGDNLNCRIPMYNAIKPKVRRRKIKEYLIT